MERNGAHRSARRVSPPRPPPPRPPPRGARRARRCPRPGLVLGLQLHQLRERHLPRILRGASSASTRTCPPPHPRTSPGAPGAGAAPPPRRACTRRSRAAGPTRARPRLRSRRSTGHATHRLLELGLDRQPRLNLRLQCGLVRGVALLQLCGELLKGLGLPRAAAEPPTSSPAAPAMSGDRRQLVRILDARHLVELLVIAIIARRLAVAIIHPATVARRSAAFPPWRRVARSGAASKIFRTLGLPGLSGAMCSFFCSVKISPRSEPPSPRPATGAPPAPPPRAARTRARRRSAHGCAAISP